MIINLYRPEFDWKGQLPANMPVLAQLSNVILGAENSERLRIPVVNTEGLMGIPRTPGVVVQQNDRIEILSATNTFPSELPFTLEVEGTWWSVTGPRRWDFPNCLTGTLPDFYWVPVLSSS